MDFAKSTCTRDHGRVGKIQGWIWLSEVLSSYWQVCMRFEVLLQYFTQLILKTFCACIAQKTKVTEDAICTFTYDGRHHCHLLFVGCCNNPCRSICCTFSNIVSDNKLFEFLLINRENLWVWIEPSHRSEHIWSHCRIKIEVSHSVLNYDPKYGR